MNCAAGGFTNGAAGFRGSPVRAAVLGLCLIAGPMGAPAQGVIEGTVSLPASPPPAPVQARYQIKTSGTVATTDPPAAVVYLEGDFPPVTSTNPPVVHLEQKDFQFSPSLLAVRKGTPVEFPNLDEEYHNVLSYSKPKRFDLGRYRAGEKAPVVIFDQPGLIRLRCEVHEHMRATILVLDTPYFAKTGPKGEYRLENVPAGRYILKAWLDEKKTVERPVELSAGQTLRVDLP